MKAINLITQEVKDVPTETKKLWQDTQNPKLLNYSFAPTDNHVWNGSEWAAPEPKPYIPDQRPRQQFRQISLKNQTNNSKQTELFEDGNSKRLIIHPDSIVSFSLKLVGTNENGAKMCDFWRKGQVKNVSGTTFLVDEIETVSRDYKDADVEILIVADDDKDCLSVFVIGTENEIWNWNAVIDLNEIFV